MRYLRWLAAKEAIIVPVPISSAGPSIARLGTVENGRRGANDWTRVIMQHELANYEAFATDHPIGARVRGRVRGVAQFGVFVELAPGVDGLLEILYFATGAPKKYPEDYPQVGTLIEATIMYFDVSRMNVRLAQRPVGGNDPSSKKCQPLSG